jgi:hypothetical protein
MITYMARPFESRGQDQRGQGAAAARTTRELNAAGATNGTKQTHCTHVAVGAASWARFLIS